MDGSVMDGLVMDGSVMDGSVMDRSVEEGRIILLREGSGEVYRMFRAFFET